MNNTKTIVNSWNEWDPLKHVIVGKADGKIQLQWICHSVNFKLYEI